MLQKFSDQRCICALESCLIWCGQSQQPNAVRNFAKPKIPKLGIVYHNPCPLGKLEYYMVYSFHRYKLNSLLQPKAGYWTRFLDPLELILLAGYLWIFGRCPRIANSYGSKSHVHFRLLAMNYLSVITLLPKAAKPDSLHSLKPSICLPSYIVIF